MKTKVYYAGRKWNKKIDILQFTLFTNCKSKVYNVEYISAESRVSLVHFNKIWSRPSSL